MKKVRRTTVQKRAFNAMGTRRRPRTPIVHRPQFRSVKWHQWRIYSTYNNNKTLIMEPLLLVLGISFGSRSLLPPAPPPPPSSHITGTGTANVRSVGRFFHTDIELIFPSSVPSSGADTIQSSDKAFGIVVLVVEVYLLSTYTPNK